MILHSSAYEYITIAIDMSTEPEVWFVTGPNIINEVRILFNLVLKSPAHHKTFFPWQLFWVYTWSGFCIGIAEDPSLRFFSTMHVKNQVLGNVFGGTFFGLPPTESLTASTLSGHLAVNFLPDLGFSTFLIKLFPALWFEICVPNDKFGSEYNCLVKLPTKFSLHSFEWFCL